MDFCSIVLLTLSIAAGLYFVHLFQKPMSVLNPYPPIELPMALPEDVISYALTETIANIPTTTATNTPQPTITQTATVGLVHTATASEIMTVEQTPSNTPDPQKIRFAYVTPQENVDEIFYTPTPHPVADYLFEFILLHEAESKQSPWNDFVSNPVLNCNWYGVGGQVLDYHGNPILGARVKLGGNYASNDEFVERYTTTSFDHIMGDGGYEFKLGDEPLPESNGFWVQVIDNNGYAISAKAHFAMTQHCTLNLVRIDFIQVK